MWAKKLARHEDSQSWQIQPLKPDLTGIAFDVLEGELDFVLGRDVLPGGQEDLLLHVAVL